MTTDNVIDISPPAPAQPAQDVGLGLTLSRARQEQDMSVEHVARQMNLPAKAIVALETEAFDVLPEPAFVRGYLRSYCRLLGIEEQPVVDKYQRQGFRDPDLVTPENEPKNTNSGALTRWMTVLLLLIVLGLSGFWWVSRDGGVPEAPDVSAAPATEETTPAATAIDSSEQLAQELAESVRSQLNELELLTPQPSAAAASTTTSAAASPDPISQPISQPVSGTASGSISGTASGPEAVPVGLSAAATTTTASTAAPSASPSAIEIAESLNASSNADSLVLVSSAQSWAEVRDDAGERLLFDMLEPGASVRLEGTAPFKVFLGNAPDVSITVNGAAIQEPEYNRTRRTARFVVRADGSTQ